LALASVRTPVDTIAATVTDPTQTPADSVAEVVAEPPASPPAAAAPLARATAGPSGSGWLIAAALSGALSVAAITLALLGQQRIKSLEQELVRRQQDSQGQAIEAHAMARQAQDVARANESKVMLLEARVSETALQRSQLEELIQQLSRSRDENVLADIDAAVRVAVQQSAITGSAEPLTAALRQAEERLARMNQPRVERVRRALARDLDRVRAVAVTDIAALTIKLDEAVRSVDELPMLSQPAQRAGGGAAAVRQATTASAGVGAATASVARVPLTAEPDSWAAWLEDHWTWVAGRVWDEVRSLVRVTRIDNPEAMLVAPEQAWFLRENLKLRLLNARLALLSRQFDTAQSDLRDAQASLDRYFDRSARRVVLAADLVRQVSGQSRQLVLPRPDETLSALAAAQAGR
jgi:uroporphyrin-3 C-methyltransferase